MKDNYIPKMPLTGWPPETRLSSKSDPGYWLTQAEGQLGMIGSSLGYFFLAKALKAILYAGAHVISATFTVGFTLADVFIELIRSGARFAAKIGDYLVRFAKLAMKFAGAALRGALTIADLTTSFLRYILDLVMRPIRIAASAAMNVIT